MDRAGNLAVVDRRGRELQYLTEHYDDLQGLRVAPAWAVFAVLEAWIGGSRPGGALWIALILFASLGWLAVKWAAWAKGWYERRYGVVWSTDEGEDERFEMISLLHGEEEDAAARRRGRIRRRWMVAVLMTLVFMLPGFWLHGAQGSAGAISLLMSLAPAYFLGPSLLEPFDGCWLKLSRRGVYLTAVLVLLMCNLLFLAGKMQVSWALAMIGAVMLGTSLYDHRLFTRLLGGAQTRGGCDE